MLCRSCLRAKLLAQQSPTTLSIARPSQRNLSTVTAAATISQKSFALPIIRAQASRPLQPCRSTFASRSYSSATAASEQPSSVGSASELPAPEKPDFLDEAEGLIWDRLASEFSPVELVVQDISGGCGSMYGIEISSERFRGSTMLKQQRMVNSVLGDLMKGWHGVQLKTRVP